MKARRKVNISWSEPFAYAIGLITSDGNLSSDGRHINLTSKDEAMIVQFKSCLGLENKIGRKSRGASKDKKYYLVQFGDVYFYRFLLTIGLTPAKSKTIGSLKIPPKYFRDFLRGCIDGDGSIGVYRHPESKHGQLRVRLCSASKQFLIWAKQEIEVNLSIFGGWIYTDPYANLFTLSYAKKDSLVLLGNLYYKGVRHFLKRKKDIADMAQRTLGE